jgi:hypothetical protein
MKIAELLTELERIKNDNPVIFDSFYLEIEDDFQKLYNIDRFVLKKDVNSLYFKIKKED